MQHCWNKSDKENQITRRQTCPSATSSTTNPARTDKELKPDVRDGRTATNRVSHVTAMSCGI